MKKISPAIIFIAIIIGFCLLSPFFSEDSNLNPFDYAHITDVDYTAVIDDTPGNNGRAIITERLTFDIHSAFKSNPFWELWRDLPEDNVDGVDVTYKVNSVKQILDNGTEKPWSKSSKLYWDDSDYLKSSFLYGPGKWYYSPGPYNEYARRYEALFFYIDGIYRDKMTFEIEYEMNNAVLRYNDCSELYLSLFSEDSVNYLKSFKGQILIPEDKMPSKENYEAHTYGTSANSFPFTESDYINDGFHTFSFNLNRSDLKFNKSNEYIEFALVSFGEDKHKFSEYANINSYTEDNVLDEIREEQEEYDAAPKKAATTKLTILLTCLVFSLIIAVKTSNAKAKTLKKYQFYSPETDFEYFREIPSDDMDPCLAAELVFCKNKSQIQNLDENKYSALLLSLVRKKYIELTKINSSKDWVTKNITIHIKNRPVINTSIEPSITSTESPIEANENLLTNLEEKAVEENIPLENNFEEVSPTLEKLTHNEKKYFDLILRYALNDEISLDTFENKIAFDFENTSTFAEDIKKDTPTIGASTGYFQKVDYTEPKTNLSITGAFYIICGILLVTLVNFLVSRTNLNFAFGGFTILGIVMIICGRYLNKISYKYVLLTQFGEDEYAKWRGLYNFLSSSTLMNERTVIELPIWEQYLVYATAFGISDKVVQALKIRCPERNSSELLSDYSYYHTSHFHTYSRTFRRNTSAATSMARSGGYGGHGGYGGGGRGGGGGRRRSLKYKKDLSYNSNLFLYNRKLANINQVLFFEISCIVL